MKDLLKAQDAESLLQAVKVLLEDGEAKVAEFHRRVARRAKRYWQGRKKTGHTSMFKKFFAVVERILRLTFTLLTELSCPAIVVSIGSKAVGAQ